MSLTWDEIVDHCSRLHTTRTRPEGPWGDARPREDSRMLRITVSGRTGRLVPTRMHEPGFYLWFDDEHYPRRADPDMATLREAVDGGLVERA